MPSNYYYDNSDIDALSLSRALNTARSGGFARLGGERNPMLVQSLLNFEDILRRRGATRPDRMNEDIRMIQTAGQAAAQDTQGDLARAGLQRSAAGQAVAAAQRAATAAQVGKRRVLESQLQEERERSDIMQFFSMLDRSLAGEQINFQSEAQRLGISEGRRNALLQAIGSLFTAFV